ncbi:unnamed protein product [Spodoptera littoralis]|uniref:Uncharacterized protein n=1 Tax=Spodoptera littoralis TaxID=7109 RepID=A0A9P0N4L0_SPOLI|nr:unnamed protein product [Spodoptera littoralis]CAH1644627.1 unnamed protein product [Spodoptera littoralis]
MAGACRIARCVRRAPVPHSCRPRVAPVSPPCRLPAVISPELRYKCYKCLLLQFRPGLRSGVRTVDVQAVEGMVAQFPCDLGTAANDKVYMVFWFRDDAGIPLYRMQPAAPDPGAPGSQPPGPGNSMSPPRSLLA